jgi:hypothetical protein
MPIYKPSHLAGRTIRPSAFHAGFNSMKDKEEETSKEQPIEASGSGLEKIADKLEKFIVKPRKKLKNIQFNP